MEVIFLCWYIHNRGNFRFFGEYINYYLSVLGIFIINSDPLSPWVRLNHNFISRRFLHLTIHIHNSLVNKKHNSPPPVPVITIYIFSESYINVICNRNEARRSDPFLPCLSAQNTWRYWINMFTRISNSFYIRCSKQ